MIPASFVFTGKSEVEKTAPEEIREVFLAVREYSRTEDIAVRINAHGACQG